MSTRATYRFRASRTTFYVHCDGYPEGAAKKFADSLVAEGQASTYMEGFVRANLDAQWIYDEPGDTEYHYELDDRVEGEPTIRVDEREDVGGEFRSIYIGPLSNWLEQELKRVFLSVNGAVMSMSFALEIVGKKIAYVELANEKGWRGNASSVAREAWVLCHQMRQQTAGKTFAGEFDLVLLGQYERTLLNLSSGFAEGFNWKDRSQEDWNDQFYPGWRNVA